MTSCLLNCLMAFGLLSNVVAFVQADCELPPSWHGLWFHSGFPDPVTIDSRRISVKGECVHQDRQHMFLIRVRESGFSSCYQCMMIYSKHQNVLQYKESYCEENIESMEALCNTIPGDAPLYTMFRKSGDLVKCPFRGPHSFSYTKGARGEVCSYPSSYLDSCSDNRMMRLRYQACLDVEGSEVATEEMSCLASWKEGSSRYLVAILNHTHVHNDESRYRCFLYQQEKSPDVYPDVVYKMAQSDKASCVGLWSVDEGVKTFRLTKIEPDHKDCHFPSWLSVHHKWLSIAGDSSSAASALHINSRERSLKLSERSPDGRTIESHVQCHKVMRMGPKTAKIVTHVKAGCDSGFVCMVFHQRDDHVMQLQYGGKSRHPSEACMNFYFDPASSPVTTFVSGGHRNTRPCPFSGLYSLTGGSKQKTLRALISAAGPNAESAMTTCPDELEIVMHAGCSDSNDLQIETKCRRHSGRSMKSHFQGETNWIMNDEPYTVTSTFTCHGKWTEVDEKVDERQRDSSYMLHTLSYSTAASSYPETNSLQLRSPSSSENSRQVLILSTSHDSQRRFVCLSYTEKDGVLSAMASMDSCDFTGSMDSFNITSSGPCLQALTGSAPIFRSFSSLTLLVTVLMTRTLSSRTFRRH